MNKIRVGVACLLLAAPLLIIAARGYAGFGTTVPVSAETATNIARSLFPVSLAVGTGNLFLTNPVVIFMDNRRIGMDVHFQAYENRPEAGIAISEEGQARVSGEVGYDLKTRQILLYEPKMDRVVFDRTSDVTRRLHAELQGAWETQVTNPIRAEVPPHPFVAPFKDGIQDISYKKDNIFIQVWYK